MARNIKTATLEAIEHELDVAWIESHTAPADEMQAVYDLAIAAGQSATMYRTMGRADLAAEYDARGRAYAARWRALGDEVQG